MGKLTKNNNKDTIDAFSSALEAGLNTYYMFAARPNAFTDDNNPPAALESYEQSVFSPLNGLLLGKKIRAADVRYLIPRHNWTAASVIDQYDHTAIDLFSKTFFVMTDENKVYKCLFNNRGAASTAKPTLTQNSVFTTSDGYVWKYMYTVSVADFINYATSDYIPITANTAVQSYAFNGIEVINIVAGGAGYITSTSGIVQSVNGSLIQLQSNARPDNHFYDGSTLYITNGASSGQFCMVQNHVVNNSGNWVTLTNAINGLVPSQTTYEINPTVTVKGDGTGATAVCRTANGVVSSVIIANNGVNYTHANIQVSANSSYGSGAKLVAAIPPLGGHGKDPVSELGCDAMGVTSTFVNNEGGTIPTEVTFRTYGILKNPTMAGNTIPYTATTFSQLLKCNTSPSTAFTVGNSVRGANSAAEAYVVYSNTSMLMLAGDKTFQAGETIVEYFANNVASGLSTAINNIATRGDLKPGTSEILYFTHVSPIPRSNTNAEIVKLVIKV